MCVKLRVKRRKFSVKDVNITCKNKNRASLTLSLAEVLIRS